MEVVGLTISIASLAGLFQTAVDYFEYVQFAKSFGADFQTSCLKLDNTYLRFTRWGETVGLGSSEAATSLKDISVSKTDVKRAEDLLGHIINLFQQAETSSRKFAVAANANDSVSAGELLSSDSRSLHQRMRVICHRRQKKTGGLKKAKWAIYEKEHLNNLIDDLRGLVDDLIELFPPVSAPQRALCDEEAAELRGEEALPALKDIAEEQDKSLQEAIARLPLQNSKTSYNTWYNADNTKVMGQVEGGQSFHGSQTFNF